MESIHKLEDSIQEWLKPLPHLPTDWRKWLADNVWWITIVGIVLSVFSAITVINATIRLMELTNKLNSFSNSFLGVNVAQNDAGWSFSVIVSIAFLVVNAIIMAMAVQPLKLKKNKGWDLMFLAYLVGIVSGLVSAVLNFQIFSLIGVAVGAVIGAYFLFEIRSHFKPTKIAKKAK